MLLLAKIWLFYGDDTTSWDLVVEERRTWIVPLAVLVLVFGGEGISSPFGVREFEVRVDGL